MTSQLKITEYNEIIKELTDIETELERNIDTTMWISDPHGAGERFVSILKGRFGLVWRTAYEALPKTFSKDKIEYLDKIIRREKYYKDDRFSFVKQDVISSLVQIIRYRVQNIKDFDSIRDSLNSDLKTLLENLILNFQAPNIAYENDIIADKVITSLSKIVKQVILGHLIVLGDVFDRGDEPDKIIRILSHPEHKKFVNFVWGNHDILWMGAAAGNRSLIAEALRISSRYDNLEFLKRIGIDTTNLQNFADKTYKKEITGKFKAKTMICKKMEKALVVIQFKLEEQTIKKYPEFEMENRLNLENLANMLKTKNTDSLNDTDFPTIDFKNPAKLTNEEKELIDDLEKQFVSSKKLKRLMKFLFEDGKMYHINNHILNIHALVPSTKDAGFETLLGKKGKEMFNHVNSLVKNVGKNYLNKLEQNEFELAFMFYLWCGPKSPFFGKNAMKTFERYFNVDKETHKETSLYWGANLSKKSFLDLIMKEFDCERIVYGHTPVNILKGEKIASVDGRAINIDGGFSDAYLSRGHALIHTPYSLYAIILPSTEEIQNSEKNKVPAKLLFEEIDTFKKPKKIKNTYKGEVLEKKRKKLITKLFEFDSKF